jgi:hypothetical protein
MKKRVAYRAVKSLDDLDIVDVALTDFVLDGFMQGDKSLREYLDAKFKKPFKPPVRTLPLSLE